MRQKILLFLLLNSLYIQSQPSIEWQKCFGGSQSDYAYDVQRTTDGGYIIANSTSSNNGDITTNHGGYDYWIVKANASGSLEWQKSFGGSNDDYATAIKQTTDGGYIVLGYTSSNNGDVVSNHGGNDIWVIKLSNVGMIEWQKSLGGSSSDYAVTILQTNDGGYTLLGNVSSDDNDITNNHGSTDVWVVKLSSNGTIVWQKTFGGSGSDSSKNLQQTADGGYIFCAETYSNDGDITVNHGQIDMWYVKLDAVGAIEWQKTLGGSNDEYGGTILQLHDESYAVVTCTGSTDGDVTAALHGGKDIWFVKLTNSGTIQSQKCIGGSFDDFAGSINQTSDQELLISGISVSNNGDLTVNYGNYDIVLFKLNTSDTIVWHKSLGGSGGDYASKIIETADGGCILVGSSTSTSGDVVGNHGFVDSWLVKLINVLNTKELSLQNTILLYPNPATNKINVQIPLNQVGTKYKVYDFSGRLLQSGILNLENNKIDISQLSKGMYLFATDNQLIKKFEKK